MSVVISYFISPGVIETKTFELGIPFPSKILPPATTCTILELNVVTE